MNIYSMTLKDLETYFINIGEKKFKSYSSIRLAL